MVFGMKPGDKYYDGEVVDSGRSVDEINKDIEEEKKESKTFNGHLICWMNEIRKNIVK